MSRTLDPTTLEVTSLPVEYHARTFIEAMRSIGGTLDVLKNEDTTFGGQPARQVEYISNYGGYQTGYGKKFFLIKDDTLFDVGFSTDPLLVPEMRPIGERILQSFQFLNNTIS